MINSFCLFFISLGGYIVHTGVAASLYENSDFSIIYFLTSAILAMLCMLTGYLIIKRQRELPLLLGNTIFTFLSIYQGNKLLFDNNSVPLLLFTILNCIFLQIVFNSMIGVKKPALERIFVSSKFDHEIL